MARRATAKKSAWKAFLSLNRERLTAFHNQAIGGQKILNDLLGMPEFDERAKAVIIEARLELQALAKSYADQLAE